MEAEPTSLDKNLLRIDTRKQAFEHLNQVLNIDVEYNPSSYEAEIYEDPEILTDLIIFFRSDDDEFALTDEPYFLFLNRYKLGEGTIPYEKFKVDRRKGIPCLRVRMSQEEFTKVSSQVNMRNTNEAADTVEVE